MEDKIQQWLDGPYDPETKEAIRNLSPEEKKEAFSSTLLFGTAGLRALMGPGPNRINIYTISQASQAVALYLESHAPLDAPVVIGFDSRHNSAQFALRAAQVFAGNGRKVFLFSSLCPTPLLSFACRYLHCCAAVMITASHNPKEYNGYKLYLEDGAQLIEPEDTKITKLMENITSPSQVKIDSSSSLISPPPSSLIPAYIEAISSYATKKKENKFCLIYSSLHGTGIELMPQALAAYGFSSIFYVKEQISIDGNFPTVPSPNPESKAALSLGIDLLKKMQADLFLVNDPDADRLGAVVRDKETCSILTGNQIAALCASYIANVYRNSNPHPPTTAVFIKSIVTTDLVKKIALAHSIECIDTAPGFKYIAAWIKHGEKEKNAKQFLFGAEESYGFLAGDYCRDKDGIAIGCLLAQIAYEAWEKGETLVTLLSKLYEQYGFFYEETVSHAFAPTEEGKKSAVYFMQKLRTEKWRKENLPPIEKIQDFISNPPLHFSSCDILQYSVNSSLKIIIRPSGTEPKIKIYFFYQSPSFSCSEKSQQEAIKAIATWKNNLLL